MPEGLLIHIANSAVEGAAARAPGGGGGLQQAHTGCSPRPCGQGFRAALRPGFSLTHTREHRTMKPHEAETNAVCSGESMKRLLLSFCF